MHVRFSSCIGLPVVEEGDGETIGTISGMLIHPDTGKVEGFFVHRPGLFGSDHSFLSTLDILRWGMRVEVRTEDVLGSLEDHIRLQPLLLDPRPVLGQQMRTERGVVLGRCKDVQFDTKHFLTEWLFPKKFFRWGTPLPLGSVVEVRRDAIIMRDPLQKERPTVPEQSALIPQFPEVAEARVLRRRSSR